MKNYYQQKKGGWCLEPVIYAKTVKQIRCYRFFQQMIRDYAEAGMEERSKMDLQDVMIAEAYVNAIDQGLQSYVPSEYREAVFAHLVDGEEYIDLEDRFFISSSTMKRYVQVFVWGVAKELGENFQTGIGA